MQSENTLQQRDESAPRWQQLLTELGLLDEISNSFPSRNSLGPTTPPTKITAIQNGLARLVETGQVVELRTLGTNGKRRVDSGYFNDMEKLAKAAISYDGRAEGIYFTVNPVYPALLA